MPILLRHRLAVTVAKRPKTKELSAYDACQCDGRRKMLNVPDDRATSP